MLKSHRSEVEAALSSGIKKKLSATGIVVQNKQKERIRDYGLIDTGRTINSVTHEVTGDSVRIGTNVSYAIYPVFGARGQTPKNWPVEGLMNAKSDIAKIWGTKIG